MTTCIFCGREGQAEHHVVPIKIKKIMGWHGDRAARYLANKTVPICTECHEKLTLLEEPLIKLIEHLKRYPPVPADFAFLIEDVVKQLSNGIIVEGKQS